MFVSMSSSVHFRVNGLLVPVRSKSTGTRINGALLYSSSSGRSFHLKKPRAKYNVVYPCSSRNERDC